MAWGSSAGENVNRLAPAIPMLKPPSHCQFDNPSFLRSFCSSRKLLSSREKALPSFRRRSVPLTVLHICAPASLAASAGWTCPKGSRLAWEHASLSVIARGTEHSAVVRSCIKIPPRGWINCMWRTEASLHHVRNGADWPAPRDVPVTSFLPLLSSLSSLSLSLSLFNHPNPTQPLVLVSVPSTPRLSLIRHIG